MELVLNRSPILTHKHLEQLKKYDANFNMVLSNKKYLDLKKRIDNGEKIPRLKSGICYDLYVSNKIIGELILAQIEELPNTYDVTISVFDEYSSKKYATTAIKQLIEMYSNSEITFQAVIKAKNKKRENLKKLLVKLGFELQDNIFNVNKDDYVLLYNFSDIT